MGAPADAESGRVGPGAADGSEPGSDEQARTLVATPAGLPAPDAPTTLGKFVGRYLVVGEIGKGGMGRVLRAYDPKLRREIALKLLRTAGSATDRARILREARAMAQLSHPHVVAVYDVDETSPTPEDPEPRVFVAMEYVAGRTLREWLDERSRSWREVLIVMLQVGEALAAAHAAGLVHRDVKPSNILIGDDARVRIGDFGLARAEADPAPPSGGASRDGAGGSHDGDDHWDTELTLADTVMGTPTFMSPEQHQATVADARSDQYGFCVTLWTALFHRAPFAGENLGQLLAAKLCGPPSPPVGTDVPRWLSTVVAKGLQADPSHRHESMAALLAALRADPGRRRTRRFAIAAIVVLVAGGLGLREIDRNRRRAACESDGRSIAEVWGPEARERVAVASQVLGSELASDSWSRLQPWLDQYAERWATMRTTACMASEVEGSASRETSSRARECLDERRDHLAALVDTLREPDAKILQRAITAAAGLPALDPCADAEALRRVPFASDPEVRAEIAAVNRRIADAISQRALGRYEAAVQISQDAVTRAQALQWAPLEARAQIVLGQTLERLGRSQAACAALEQAASRAAIAGHDALAADATTALIGADGERRGRFEEGLRWSWITEVLLERAGAHDELRVAAWQAQLGGLQRARGAFDEALTAYARALAIRERILGEAHPETASIYNARGTVYLERGDLLAAAADLERALELRELTLGPRSPLVAATLAHLAELRERQGDLDGAIMLYQRALTTWGQEVGPGHPQAAAVREAIGYCELAAGRPARAIAQFELALSINEAAFGPDDPDLAKSLEGLSEARLAEKDVAAALEAAERAVRLCERDPVDPARLSTARLVLARAAAAAGDGQRAVALATRARDDAPPESPARRAAAQWLDALPKTP